MKRTLITINIDDTDPPLIYTYIVYTVKPLFRKEQLRVARALTDAWHLYPSSRRCTLPEERWLIKQNKNFRLQQLRYKATDISKE